MTSAQRGFLWIAVLTAIGVMVCAFTASSLWRAGAKEQRKAARYQHLAGNRDQAMGDLEKMRREATLLQRGYIRANSAAQAEALLREEISKRVSETGGELSSIQTQPAERGDPEGALRLRVVLTTPQSSLGTVLTGLNAGEPLLVTDSSEIRIASGIRRPGASSNNSSDKPLNLSLDISAFWKEPTGNG